MTIDVLTWVSPAQASRELGVTPNRVRQLAAEGRLRFVMTANGRLIDPESIQKYQKTRRLPKATASRD